MRKSEFNTLFREHARDNLSPTEQERRFVTRIYESLQDTAGENNTLQIGSYPRFTSIRPIHDLDVLYLCGKWEAGVSDPSNILSDLKTLIENEYDNPTQHDLRVELQTHSVTIIFLDGDQEVFSVDVVPAYSFRTNEFEQDTYMVPEILTKSRQSWTSYYDELGTTGRQMRWIRSDPRGYIQVAQDINTRNEDFRKTVKFIKAWKAAHKEWNESFKLKSFHLEQIVTSYFLRDPSISIFDAVFNFFHDLPQHISRAQIQDRAHANKYIDDYLKDMTVDEREKVTQARDFFLIKLEGFAQVDDMADLCEVGFRQRADGSEDYLFDHKIPILTEEEFEIRGRVFHSNDVSLAERFLDVIGLVDLDKNIEFRIQGNKPQADIFKWKVKNDDSAKEPRGEITDHSTKNDPESTKYKGNHFVECYAVRDSVCIAKARQNVKI